LGSRVRAVQARDVYWLIRQALDPAFATDGFRRTPRSSFASWFREVPDGILLFWFQVAPGDYSLLREGSDFTVEFQLGPDRLPGGSGARERLWRLSSQGERERAEKLNENLLRKLSRPGYDLRSASYEPTADLWFRYVGEDDILRWADFLRPILPVAAARFLANARTPDRAGKNQFAVADKGLAGRGSETS
jgi:hypothetical protein